MVYKFQTDNTSPAVNRFRFALSQFVACMSPNLLLLDLGMAISFPTIALPDLLNASEGLSLDETHASWFGSVAYITQPVGAMLSGPMVDYFGRKKANFFANFPHLIAWTLMYFAWNVPSLLIANVLLGLGTGIMEAPINSYVGEISHPSLRGTLCTVTQLFTAVGVFAMYFLGTVVSWRSAALISIAAPISSMLLVLLVPETPVWLLVHGKEKEALKSLCFLRGWTSNENVRNEFDELVVYTNTLQQCVICYKSDKEMQKDTRCDHVHMNIFKRLFLKFRYVMLSKETLRPLCLMVLYFSFFVMSGLTPIRANMINVCGAFGMTTDGKDVVMMVGMITFITSVMVVGLIRILGKRKLAISALFGTALSCTALSAYAKTHLSSDVYSYNPDTFPTEKSSVPLIIFYAMAIFTGLGIPWVLLGEVFPFRSRATAQGMAAAWNYVITFIGTKTFIDLEFRVHLWGTFAVYAGLGFIGAIYLYLFLPETEGKTLQEIENYYSGKCRTFADDPFINFFRRLKRRSQ